MSAKQGGGEEKVAGRSKSRTDLKRSGTFCLTGAKTAVSLLLKFNVWAKVMKYVLTF